MQKEHFAERYIRYGRPGEALAWLEGDWGYREEGRERLLAQAYAALGDLGRMRAVRQMLFERTGSVSDFEPWRESLAPADCADATEVARQRAKMHDDPITGARLLLALGDDAAAEVLLLAHHGNVQGGDYDRLVPLAQALEKKGRLLGTIVCYRALLVAILTRAYARAYGHAAEYLGALRRLDGAGGRLRLAHPASSVRVVNPQHARSEGQFLEPNPRLASRRVRRVETCRCMLRMALYHRPST